MLHCIAKDIYQNVVIASYWNYTTGDLTAYVTSDLWSGTSGTVAFTLYDWSGDKLNESSTLSSVDFEDEPLNTTKVLQANTNNYHFDLSSAISGMNLTATGVLPNSKLTANTTFTHEFSFHPTLSFAPPHAQLVNPGLQLQRPSNISENTIFTVAATEGVSSWTWLNVPAGVSVNFDSNGFWLVPNEPREVGFTLKNDTTGGEWVKNVTVSSLWDFTTP